MILKILSDGEKHALLFHISYVNMQAIVAEESNKQRIMLCLRLSIFKETNETSL